MVEPNDGQTYDIDLGQGHTLTWSRYEDKVVGGIIRHPADNEVGYCESMFWLKDNKFSREFNPEAAQWIMTGDFKSPTLSPSFFCHCKKDHGFVTEGKWVRV